MRPGIRLERGDGMYCVQNSRAASDGLHELGNPKRAAGFWSRAQVTGPKINDYCDQRAADHETRELRAAA